MCERRHIISCVAPSRLAVYLPTSKVMRYLETVSVTLLEQRTGPLTLALVAHYNTEKEQHQDRINHQ